MQDQLTLFQQGVKYLEQHGLNLTAVFDLDQLPTQIIQAIQTTSKKPVDVSRFARLVMLGNGGKRFWDALAQHHQHHEQRENPIDTFTLHLTQRFIEDVFTPIRSSHSLILYPQPNYSLPLQQLGTLAGWGTPSPIGNSIDGTYGLWFAFRSAFLTSLPVPVTPVDLSPSPCLLCEDKPCQTACPVRAVRDEAVQFELGTCIDHRLRAESSCAARCFARLACPIGREHQYPDWAIEQLYRSSLSAIKTWRDMERDMKRKGESTT